MTIQSVVEKLHRQRVMNKDSLANKVEEVFFKFEGYTMLAAIAFWWELVLDLILDDQGGNDLVETKQGTLKKSLIGTVLLQVDVYLMDP